ncbi:MAG: DNA-binding protein WhiA [Lachnospiraceae bacterium]|nr:DNA-binding protein WhiA [Lachnospiraceae bacterium]
MSFSGEVKQELEPIIGSARHCRLAELAALFSFYGRGIRSEEGFLGIRITTENRGICIKCFTLLKKTFNMEFGVSVRRSAHAASNPVYELRIEEPKAAQEVLMALKLYDAVSGLRRPTNAVVSTLLIKGECCKRAFLRGCFLTVGSMSDPQKGYHMEFVCDDREHADTIISVLRDFDIEAKQVLRKRYFVVYLKDGEQIVDLLNVMGAHVALMELENTRILKEMRNSVNRRVNCEAANITKTVNAAGKQVEDIEYLAAHGGLGGLPESLRDMAQLRLDHPDATLSELSELSDPHIGKSGINHRLRKISEMAERLRNY